LHCALSNLIQATAHPRLLKLDFALVDLLMAVFAQTEQIGKRILAAVFFEDDMVSLQADVFLAALLARVPIAHEAGET